jgi:hypothetical protein
MQNCEGMTASEQSHSSEPRMASVSQEIPRMVRNQKIHNRAHKSTPLVPIVSQINPVHAPLTDFFKVYSIFQTVGRDTSLWTAG